MVLDMKDVKGGEDKPRQTTSSAIDVEHNRDTKNTVQTASVSERDEGPKCKECGDKAVVCRKEWRLCDACNIKFESFFAGVPSFRM